MRMTAERFKQSMKFLDVKTDAQMADILGVDRRSIYNFKKKGAPHPIKKSCKLAELLVFGARKSQKVRDNMRGDLLNGALQEAENHILDFLTKIPQELYDA